MRKKVSLFAVSVLILFLFTPLMANAQGIKVSIGELLSNPDKYDGKMVQVEGKVSMLKFKTSKSGNPYTTFKVSDDSNNSVSVFSFGTLSIAEMDLVRVVGRYQKVKYVPPRYTFYNEIDASTGSVDKVKYEKVK